MLSLFGTIFCLRCVFLFDLITTLTQFRRSLFITEKSISDSFHSYVINKISNSLSFITKFITFVGKNDIMLGIISCLPTHVINLVINDNSLEILYLINICKY